MKKRDEYLELKKKHQEEFEDFPIAYAFNDKQLQEALEKTRSDQGGVYHSIRSWRYCEA